MQQRPDEQGPDAHGQNSAGTRTGRESRRDEAKQDFKHSPGGSLLSWASGHCGGGGGQGCKQSVGPGRRVQRGLPWLCTPSREQRAESREQRAESREQSALSCAVLELRDNGPLSASQEYPCVQTQQPEWPASLGWHVSHEASVDAPGSSFHGIARADDE
ncbi:hypothetical protein CDD82_5782 [Ophiocordyceps australis]|uniref:Uncharacterized protein n=1 Tax=Ophiocordyceps australis TaxID=1399860 RepID=A0A2C5YTI9_9HYPO|nr:hypothetical protein CDD82_5782 [Ophiocordyceps australis]